jgi:hypothetical protein
MTDYEQRARKLIENAAKTLPDIPTDEQTVKELAAALPKAEAVTGRNSPGLWDLAKVPFTGRVHGVEVERGLWAWGLLLLKIISWIVVPIFSLLFGLLTLFMFWGFGRWWWTSARATERGVEIFSAVRGTTASYAWSDIVALRRVSHGPALAPQLELSNGNFIIVPLADWAALAGFAEAHAIRIDDPWKHDG